MPRPSWTESSTPSSGNICWRRQQAEPSSKWGTLLRILRTKAPRADRRPRPVAAQDIEGADAPPQHRLRLPGLQAAAEPDRRRERRLRAEGAGREQRSDPQEGARGARDGRAVAQDELAAGRAVGRRA